MHLPFMRRTAYDLLRKEKKQIDWLMWFAGIVGPVSTLPQIYDIFITKEVAGISILSWVLYAVTAFISLLYAIIHKLKIFIFTNTIWIFIDLIIVLGVVMYD